MAVKTKGGVGKRAGREGVGKGGGGEEVQWKKTGGKGDRREAKRKKDERWEMGGRDGRKWEG